MGNIDQRLIIGLGLFIPGLMTGLGAIPIFFTNEIKRSTLDILLGFAAGVMLAASCFSLIIPSIEYGGGGVKAVLVTSLGIFAGALMLDLIDKYAPHEHLLDKRKEGSSSESLKKIWLFIIAITIHNFPEGLATGVGFGTNNIANGITIALGIGLQNMPEGLAVALALLRENYSTKEAFFNRLTNRYGRAYRSTNGLWIGTCILTSTSIYFGSGRRSNAIRYKR